MMGSGSGGGASSSSNLTLEERKEKAKVLQDLARKKRVDAEAELEKNRESDRIKYTKEM